jgi:hypothetical protein
MSNQQKTTVSGSELSFTDLSAELDRLSNILAHVVDEKGHQLIDRRRLGRGGGGGGGALQSKEQQKEKKVEEQKEREAKDQKEREAKEQREEQQERRLRESALAVANERQARSCFFKNNFPTYGGGISRGIFYEDCNSHSSSSRSSGPRCMDGSLDMKYACCRGLDKWND